MVLNFNAETPNLLVQENPFIPIQNSYDNIYTYLLLFIVFMLLILLLLLSADSHPSTITVTQMKGKTPKLLTSQN